MKKMLLSSGVIILGFIILGFMNLNAGDFKRAMKSYNNGDYKSAIPLLKKVCDNSDPRGCYNLGVIYYKSLGVQQNYQEASKFYQKACDVSFVEFFNHLW